MKFMRFLSGGNQQHTGILRSDNTIEEIEGDLLNEYTSTGKEFKTDDIKEYLFPVNPPNIIALGLNYQDHAKESNMKSPEAPLIFLKATTSIEFHQNNIVLPKEAPSEVDYEAELCIVIGKKAKNISPDVALEYVFGYTCAHDVSARDCQLRIDKQWARGKSFDTFAPVGPVMETELDTSDLRVRLLLNGECMQDASTRDLIFAVPNIVSYLSRNMTLLPGTLIFTGTPAGVGCMRTPPIFLKPGDRVVVEIEGIGSLENHVALE